MPVFSTSLITRFSHQAEEDIALDLKCIGFRYALDIVSGTATYTLPDYIFSIRQITWKGFIIDPMPQRDLRQSLLSGAESGRPYWYIYNATYQSIQLFPTPNESITADQSDLFITGIPTQCIVDSWRLPDFSTYILPVYLRRRLIKAFVMKECYAAEGKGQSMKAVNYWSKKYDFLLEQHRGKFNDLIIKPRNLVANVVHQGYPKVPRPILPINRFGVGVDD